MFYYFGARLRMKNLYIQRFNITTLVILDALKQKAPFDVDYYFSDIHERVNHFFDESEKVSNDNYVVEVTEKLQNLGYINYRDVYDQGVIGVCLTARGMEHMDIKISSIHREELSNSSSNESWFQDICKAVIAGKITNLI